MQNMSKMSVGFLLLFISLLMSACGSAPSGTTTTAATGGTAAVAVSGVVKVTSSFGAVTGLANGRATTIITITALDAIVNGNPVANAPVSVNISGNQVVVGAVTTTTVSGTTNALGIFTAKLTYIAADGVTITPTAGGVAGVATAAPIPTVNNIQMSAPIASGAVADGAATYTITAKLLDAGGNAIVGETVSFGATSTKSGLINLSPSTAVSDAAGFVTVLVSDISPVNEQVTVSASAAAIVRSVTVSFDGTGSGSSTALNGNQLTMTLLPVSVPADGYTSVLVSVHAQDTYSNINAANINAANINVTLSQNGSASILPGAAQTDVYGNISFTVTDSAAETVTLTASDGYSSVASSLTFSPHASILSIRANKSSFVADGQDVVSYTLTASGPHGAVAGERIRLAISSPTAVANPPVFVTTGANGQATVSLTDTTSGRVTMTASTRDGGALPGQVVSNSVDIYAAIATPQILIAQSGPFLADGFTAGHAVRLTIRDKIGAVQANQPISLTLSSTTAGVSDQALNQAGGTGPILWSNANGIIDVFVSDSVAKLVTLTATAADLTTATSTIQFAAVNADSVSLTASPMLSVPNTSITFTATVQNTVPNQVVNAWVQFDAYAGSVRIGQSTALTSAVGIATANFSFATVGLTDVYATLVFNPQATTVQAVQQVQTVYATPQVLIDAAGPYLADGVTAAHAVRIRVNDNLGAPIANQPITISFDKTTATASTQSVNQPGGVSPVVYSSATGVIDVYVSDSVAELVTLIATPEAGTAASSTIQFIAANANSVIATASPANANPDGASAITITASVKTAAGVAVANAWVSFSTLDPYVNLSSATALTGTNGQATLTLTSFTPVAAADIYATLTFNGGQQDFAGVSFVDVVSSVLLTPQLSNVQVNGQASFIAKVLSATGQRLANRVVTFSHQSSATVPTQLTTDTYGEVLVTVTDAIAETVNVSATSEGVASLASIALTFTPVIGSMTMVVQPSTNAVPADGTSPATIIVNLKDLYSGAPIVGQNVQFIDDGYTRYAAGYVSSAQLSASSAVTDTSGTATITVVDPYAESVTIRAIAGGQSKTGTINFTHTQLQFIISADQPFLADGVQDHYVTILARDNYANPIAGQVFQVSSGSATMIPSQTQLVTDNLGQARVSVFNGVAETATLTFTDGGALSFAAPIMFVAANPSSMTMTITPDTVVTPDGTTPATITIQVKDKFGAAVSNAWVQLDAYSVGVPDTSAQLANSSLLTGATGIASTTVTRIAAGTTTITARMTKNPNVAIASAVAVFDAPVTAVLLTPSTTQVRADGASSITLTARVLGGAGQRLAGRTVVFNHQSSATVTTPAVTNANGETTVTIINGAAETVAITAISDNIASTATSLTFTTVVNSMTLNVLPSTGAVPADGTSTASIVVNLKDAYGAPISGSTVRFLDDGYTSAARLSSATAITDATGTAIITVTDVYTETVTIRAIADNQSKTGTVSFTLSSFFILVSTNEPFLADGIQDHYVTIEVTDNFGQPIPNQVFLVNSDSLTMIESQSQITTGPNGRTSFSVMNSVAETANLTFTDPGGTALTLPIQFVAANVASLSIRVSPVSDVNPDGSTPATVTVYVKDINGAAVANAWVSLSSSNPNTFLAGGVIKTGADGIATTTVTSIAAGATTITATAPRNLTPVVAPVSASVVFSVPVASVQLTASQTTLDAYGTAVVAGLTATLLDADGQIIAGRIVDFSIISGQASLATLTGTSSATGILTSDLYSGTSGLVQVTATAGGVTSAPLSITFVPVVNTMTMTITPSSKSVAADGTSTISAIINLKAVDGTPIAGQTVRLFDDSFSSAQFNSPTAITNTAGTATFTISNPVAEAVNIRSIAGSHPASWKQASDTIQFANTTLQLIVTGAQPFLADSNNHALNLLVKDQNGNALTTPQAFTLSSSTATMIPATLQVSTDATGNATLNVANSIAETATLTMTHASGLVFSVPVQFISADPYAMQVSVTPTTGVLPDGVSVATATVIVTDKYGAVVPNAWVQFKALTGTGAVDIYATLSASSLFTGATGRAAVTMSRTKAGSTDLNVSLPRNTTIAAQSITVSFAGKVAQVASKISLSASAYTLHSDGSDVVTLTAQVKDTLNVGVDGATITFTPTSAGDAGVLSATSAVTDAYGRASVTLGAGTFDRSNRTITVVANVANAGDSSILPIIVLGSTVSAQVINSSSLVADGVDSSNIVVTVKDSAGNPIPFVPVSGLVTVSGNNNLSVDVYAGSHLMLQTTGGTWLGDTYTTTNTSGSITLDVYAHSTVAGGQIEIAPFALGAITSVILSPSLSGDIFGIISPYQTATQVPTISLNRMQTIVVASSGQVRQTAIDLFALGLKADPYAYVKLSSSLGNWASIGGLVGVDPYVIVPFSLVSPYSASANYYGTVAGQANIQADEYAGPTTASISYSDPATGLLVNRPLQSASILMQVNAITPAAVSVTALSSTVTPSTATQQNSTTITATVRDVTNKAVSNIPVTFSIASGPGGGERMSPVTVFTDAGGNARSNFISGGLPSAANGIDVYAQVFTNGQVITGSTQVTIGSSAVSVSLGTSSFVGSSGDGTSYILPMSALVTDINGSAIVGAVITLRVRPKYFAFGHRMTTETDNFALGDVGYWPGYFFDGGSSGNNLSTASKRRANSNAAVAATAIGFSAEDRNNNQILDYVTVGLPEDGYTKFFDFKSPLSSEIVDQYTTYRYKQFSGGGVGGGVILLSSTGSSSGTDLYAAPLANLISASPIVDALGNVLSGTPANYMSTNNGSPSCQPLTIAQMTAIVGVPPSWYCTPMLDGVLTPAHASAGSVPQTAVTGVDGLASFDFTYQKQYARWLVVEVMATIQNTAGSESVGKISFQLAESVGDTNSRLLAAYPVSPFGDKP